MQSLDIFFVLTRKYLSPVGLYENRETFLVCVFSFYIFVFDFFLSSVFNFLRMIEQREGSRNVA